VRPDAFEARSEALKIGAHYDFTEAAPNLGIPLRSSLNFGAGPIVALGIIDKAGELGRIGGGIYDPPLSIFASAMDALDRSYEPGPIL
jgi:hypothetical protein